MPGLKTVNLKGDMPSLAEARQRLSQALAAGRSERCVAVKLIHGYGSSGTGGVLREGIRASLRKRRKKGEISGYIFGENWSVFDEATRLLLERAPELRRDTDLDRGNEGISIAVFHPR
ncbi:MAG TPA: Smr/MutS family protein [Phycisphaerae bacterium]|nr:Smr/MutS family protein [Phycisphaerae bacterium]